MTTVEATDRPGRTVPDGPLYRSPLGLFDFQAEDVASAYVRTDPGGLSGILAVWDMGLGKAEPVSEPVLTPGGWVPIGEIRPGDQVFSADGTPAKVESVHPQVDREIYRVTFSDGSWTRCTRSHLWTVGYWGSDRSTGRQRRVRREETITLQELMDRGIKTPAGRRKFSIPVTAPVQHPPVFLPMDPYALGVILGDGWISRSGLVQITSDWDIVRAVTPDKEPRVVPGCWQVNTSRWQDALTSLGLVGHRAWEKFVPEVYLRAPEGDRRALLAGLLDTDGSPIEDGGVEFSSTSRALVDAVVELTQSLGGVARRGVERTTSYSHNDEVRQGRTSYRVNVKLPTNPFRLKRKALLWKAPAKYGVARHFESIERVEDEDAVCIKIDREDGLYLTRHHIVTHNTHLAMALAALLFEDDAIDLVMVVAERNKITDWRDDFARFTSLTAHRYHGQGRQKRLDRSGIPHVFVTTYETGRNELVSEVKVKGKRGTHRVDGSLTDRLGLRDKRVLWVFDEVTKLKGRGSQTHKAYAHLLHELRGGPHHQRVLGLTGTPMERDWEDAFNIARIVCPERMPTIGQFESTFVREIDRLTGRYVFHRERMHVFAETFRSLILRKRKTDPDVAAQFPRLVEESVRVTLDRDHMDLYETVEGILDPEGADPRSEREIVSDERRLWTVLRMTAGHPCSHLHADNTISRTIAEELGPGFLSSITSSKTRELVERLKPLVKGQGAQVVVFTFYGNTVLRELVKDLRSAGFSTVSYHGGNSLKANDDAKAAFVRGDVEIMVTSDAGSKGISLSNASYVVEYESSLTYANRVQRINRASRIDGGGGVVTAWTFVAEDTIEEGILDKVLRRNEDQDLLLGDTEDGSAFVSAQTRRELLQVARTRKRRSR